MSLKLLCKGSFQEQLPLDVTEKLKKECNRLHCNVDLYLVEQRVWYLLNVYPLLRLISYRFLFYKMYIVLKNKFCFTVYTNKTIVLNAHTTHILWSIVHLRNIRTIHIILSHEFWTWNTYFMVLPYTIYFMEFYYIHLHYSVI